MRHGQRRDRHRHLRGPAARAGRRRPASASCPSASASATRRSRPSTELSNEAFYERLTAPGAPLPRTAAPNPPSSSRRPTATRSTGGASSVVCVTLSSRALGDLRVRCPGAPPTSRPARSRSSTPGPSPTPWRIDRQRRPRHLARDGASRARSRRSSATSSTALGHRLHGRHARVPAEGRPHRTCLRPPRARSSRSSPSSGVADGVVVPVDRRAHGGQGAGATPRAGDRAIASNASPCSTP